MAEITDISFSSEMEDNTAEKVRYTFMLWNAGIFARPNAKTCVSLHRKTLFCLSTQNKMTGSADRCESTTEGGTKAAEIRDAHSVGIASAVGAEPRGVAFRVAQSLQEQNRRLGILRTSVTSSNGTTASDEMNKCVNKTIDERNLGPFYIKHFHWKEGQLYCAPSVPLKYWSLWCCSVFRILASLALRSLDWF